MSKGNSKDFCVVIGIGFSSIERYAAESEDLIIKRSHDDSMFIPDYSRAILHYYKACGCKILNTNNNWWNDRFYVYMTKPTKAVDPAVWFDETYRDGIYWSSNKLMLLGNILLIAIIGIVVYLTGGFS